MILLLFMLFRAAEKQVFGSEVMFAGTGCQTFAFVRWLSFLWFLKFGCKNAWC